MSSGAYIALSGLQARAEQLNRLAGDLANAATVGYKGERSTTAASERKSFDAALKSAIDVAVGPTGFDFSPGTIATTGREMDLAIDGSGFFVVDTPQGLQYTRNGSFSRRSDGMLATREGYAIVGEDGRPLELPEGGGAIKISQDGQMLVGNVPIGKPRIVDFDDYASLARRDAARFTVGAAVTAKPVADARLVSGVLEESNVSVVERMAQVTEVTRSFEALQRGVTIMMNDLDGRAITELGRR